jgi:biopolymer transport protein ExbD
MKKAILIILVLINLCLVKASELSISPPEFELSGKINQKLCQTIIISSDKNEKFFIENKWAEKNKIKKDLNAHNLNAEDLNLNISYSTPLSYEKNSEIEVCFTAEKAGLYHGAIIFNSYNSYSSIGSWVLLDIEKEQNPLIQITGKAISNLSAQTDNSNLLIAISIVLIIILIFLLVILLVLSVKRKNKTR